MGLTKKRQFGDIGEKIAEDFIINKGYKIIEKNYRVKNLGEIDIIGLKDKKITFFEVKTRDVLHETTFPIGFSINDKKLKNLKRVCQIYIYDRNYEQNQGWQVDALFVSINNETGTQELEHVENILWERKY